MAKISREVELLKQLWYILDTVAPEQGPWRQQYSELLRLLSARDDATPNTSVLQDWLVKLPIRMQSTLVLGLRGPDGMSTTYIKQQWADHGAACAQHGGHRAAAHRAARRTPVYRYGAAT
jgi:hypothetical protein